MANERVTEGDVPRVQRVELSLEVLAADAERCGAVRHAFQRDERLRRAAYACGAGQRQTAVPAARLRGWLLAAIAPWR